MASGIKYMLRNKRRNEKKTIEIYWLRVNRNKKISLAVVIFV